MDQRLVLSLIALFVAPILSRELARYLDSTPDTENLNGTLMHELNTCIVLIVSSGNVLVGILHFLMSTCATVLDGSLW